MQDVLEDFSSKNPGSISESQDLGFSQSYFPNLFAEALVPINPRRWAAFDAGSAITSDMPDIGDKIKTLLDNLLVAKVLVILR